MLRTIYRTLVNNVIEYEGENKERAIRTWDAASVARVVPKIYGGIEVQTFDGDLMVRDGWLLHVSSSGHVYLNPRP